jgi:hypothetical protein
MMDVLSGFIAGKLIWILVIAMFVAVAVSEAYENFGWGLFSVVVFVAATYIWKAVPWEDWRNFNWTYIGIYIAGMFVYGLSRMYYHGRKIGEERIAWKNMVQEAVQNKHSGYKETFSKYEKDSLNPNSYDYHNYVPSSKDSKKKYAFWTLCWPSSLLFLLLKDLLKDFAKWFVRLFKNLFDWFVNMGENSALKGKDLTVTINEDKKSEDNLK